MVTNAEFWASVAYNCFSDSKLCPGLPSSLNGPFFGHFCADSTAAQVVQRTNCLILTVRRLTAEIAEAIKSVEIPLYFNYSEYDDCVPKILEKRRDFEFD